MPLPDEATRRWPAKQASRSEQQVWGYEDGEGIVGLNVGGSGGDKGDGADLRVLEVEVGEVDEPCAPVSRTQKFQFLGLDSAA